MYTRQGIFGQPGGAFGPMLGSAPRTRGAVLPLTELPRRYPWISPGEVVDDGADRWSVAADGPGWVRINFYGPGGWLVDQQDFFHRPRGLSGMLMRHMKLDRLTPPVPWKKPSPGPAPQASPVAQTAVLRAQGPQGAPGQMPAGEAAAVRSTAEGIFGQPDGSFGPMLNGPLVPHFMARMGPTMLREAPDDASGDALTAMEQGVETEPGTNGMGCYRCSGGMGIVPTTPQYTKVGVPEPTMDFTEAQAGISLVSASVRTLQSQLRKVGAGCISTDGKWGPNTSGAYQRWAAGAGQSPVGYRNAEGSARATTGQGTVYITASAKRRLASDASGRTDECGRATVHTSSSTAVGPATDVPSELSTESGSGVPGWVWGASAGVIVLGGAAAFMIGKKKKGK